jgi:hemerythrin-like metal-binding protein
MATTSCRDAAGPHAAQFGCPATELMQINVLATRRRYPARNVLKARIVTLTGHRRRERGMSEQMQTMQWDERFSVGVQQFDADHRRLLALAEEMVHGAAQDPLPVDAGEVLGELIAAAEEHFAHEEHLLRITSYPRLEAHRREHRRLLQEIRAWRLRLGAGQAAPQEVARSVVDWVLDHIEQQDRLYAAHLNGHGYR